MSKLDLTFSKRLEKIMFERDLYPAQVAKLTGVRRGMIYEYIKGAYQPTAYNIKLIAKGLNVSADWLLGLSEEQ
ncbi:MAG: helix-turn-helix domain-containing protein [Ruminococcus sp.]